MSKDIPSEGKAKVLLFRRDFFAFWDCCIINEAWKGNVDSYLAGVIRGVARFISVYEGEYSRERLVQQLARTHPKTPSRSWLRKTPEVLQTATCGRFFASITVPAVR